MKDSTQLRYVFSKSPETIVQWVNSLPFKIEIKSGPVISGGKFYLFFILHEDNAEGKGKAMIGGNLDG